MTDVTVDQSQSPQTQPGGARTSDGTLLDQQPASTETPKPGAKTDGSTNADGSSFITGKVNAEPDDGKAPTAEGNKKPDGEGDKKSDAAAGAPEKYEDFKL